MLYRKIIAVCSQIHTKHINTLCGHKVELLNVKSGGTSRDHWALEISNKGSGQHADTWLCFTATECHAMNQGVSRWSLTVEVGFSPRKIHVGFAVDKVPVWNARYSPVNITSPMLRTEDSFTSHDRCVILARDSTIKLRAWDGITEIQGQGWTFQKWELQFVLRHFQPKDVRDFLPSSEQNSGYSMLTWLTTTSVMNG
jgi:hypothetical protein